MSRGNLPFSDWHLRDRKWDVGETARAAGDSREEAADRFEAALMRFTAMEGDRAGVGGGSLKQIQWRL